MSTLQSRTEAQAGDWFEAHGTHGKPARRGRIVEVLGSPGREHYRVSWDPQHESIVYPTDGVTVARADQPPTPAGTPARSRAGAGAGGGSQADFS